MKAPALANPLVLLLILMKSCTGFNADRSPIVIEARRPTLEGSTSMPATGWQAGTAGKAALVLTIISPLDNAVVNQAQIELVGKVSRETVMSINEEITDLGSGDFSIPITLEEGPNALEIVASDTDGNEVDLVLTVIYEP